MFLQNCSYRIFGKNQIYTSKKSKAIKQEKKLQISFAKQGIHSNAPNITFDILSSKRMFFLWRTGPSIRVSEIKKIRLQASLVDGTDGYGINLYTVLQAVSNREDYGEKYLNNTVPRACCIFDKITLTQNRSRYSCFTSHFKLTS